MILANRFASKIPTFLLISSFLAIYGCKTLPSKSGLLAVAASGNVTETGALNKSIKIKGKGLTENLVEIAVDDTGLLRIEVTLVSNSTSGFTKPVTLAAFFEDDLDTALAKGDVKIPSSSTIYAEGTMYINAAKEGKYYVLVQHNQQLDNANDSGTVRTRLIQANPADAYVINTLPGYFDSTETYDGTGIKIGLTAPKSLSTIGVYTRIYASSPNVISGDDVSCPTCKPKLVISDTSNSYEMPVDINQNNNGEAAFQFTTGTYNLLYAVENLPAGSLVELNLSIEPITNNQGGPFSTTGTLGMLPITFDQRTQRRATSHGKPFGFTIDSDRSAEAMLNIRFDYKRILNLATSKTFPKKVEVVVSDAGNNEVSKTEIDGEGNYFDGKIIGDFETNKYSAVFNMSNLDDSDILDLTGEFNEVELTIRDGGPPVSNFKDLAPVTITPPSNYLVDFDVKKDSVHTPTITPLDLASASVLAGMEKIRAVQHLRIPKGLQRGQYNKIDANTISACLGNEAAHWSDIIIHYYCQYGEARSCYTNTIRNKATAIGADATLDKDAKIKKLATIRLEAFAECAATAPQNPDWAWIMDKQQGDQAEVFQYIMNSQTFAFDMAQQQALINKFYRIDNPKSAAECNLKRPRRAIDPSDGTHCLATKIFSPSMKAAFR